MAAQSDLLSAVAVVVSGIESARVATYGDVAAQVGVGPRQAGRLVKLLPEDVPWWRVVRADGRPATCRGGRADHLLRGDGVPMSGDRVDLARARNRFPPTWHDPAAGSG